MIKSVQTSLRILSCFTNNPPTLGVTEIAKELRLTKSTVSRILSTLEQARFVAKVADTQKYRLGAKILELAGVFLSGHEWRTVAIPHMKALRDTTGETVVLFAVDRDQRFCLERCESAHELRPTVTIGGRYPLHAGASGKLLLAHLPPDERAEILGRTGLPRYTTHTITNPKDLERELQDIRRKGYAVSHQERLSHMSSVSAPIRGFDGQVVAALCVDGPTARLTARRLKTCVRLALDAAGRISQDIGFRHGGAGPGDGRSASRPSRSDTRALPCTGRDGTLRRSHG